MIRKRLLTLLLASLLGAAGCVENPNADPVGLGDGGLFLDVTPVEYEVTTTNFSLLLGEEFAGTGVTPLAMNGRGEVLFENFGATSRQIYVWSAADGVVSLGSASRERFSSISNIRDLAGGTLGGPTVAVLRTASGTQTELGTLDGGSSAASDLISALW